MPKYIIKNINEFKKLIIIIGFVLNILKENIIHR